MIISVPVVKVESSDARKATAPEISLTSARRPMGVCAADDEGTESAAGGVRLDDVGDVRGGDDRATAGLEIDGNRPGQTIRGGRDVRCGRAP